MSESLIERVRERLAAESAPLRPNVVAAAIRAESGGVLGDTEVLSNLRTLQTELTGVGILEPLLRAQGATDVLVTAPDAVWIDDGNGLRRSSIQFADEAAVRRLAQRLALSVGRRLDEAQPWVDGQLVGVTADQFTVRLHAVLAPIASAGTCLSLRVLRPATQDLAMLTGSGAIAAQAATLLDRIITARLAFLVSGGTGAGKTTLLSAALGAVASSERIICVEDAAELQPRHPHLVNLVARCANVEGIGEITVRDLVRQALRMRPDRIVVGEVRGAEVVDLLAALNTGHDGGAGTVHANNPAEVPPAWKRSRRSAASTASRCTASSRPRFRCSCTSVGTATASGGSARSRCFAAMPVVWSGLRRRGTPTADSTAAQTNWRRC